MKKHNIFPIALILSLGIGISAATFSVVKQVQVDALTLPTTLNLNDSTSDEIREYYSYLNDLDSSEKHGENLLKNLKYILVNNPNTPSKPARYFTFSEDRRISKITDRQWSQSPASEIANYNSNTGYVTSYDYSSDNPYIHFYYRSDNDTNPHRFDAKQYNTDGGSMTMLNQEHLWSVSHGFDNKTTGASSRELPNAGTDLHHLVTSDAAVNQWGHSNYSYGDVGNDSSNWASTRTKWDNGDNAILGNKRGEPSDNYEVDTGSPVVFEPQDSDKGDIARALLYMVARYNYIGTEIAYRNASVAEPDLTLVNRIINSATSSTPGANPVEYGCLDTLLKWHQNDPVDEYEIHRNNLIYNNFQYTRNPFIDFPSWVNHIWGTSEEAVNPSTNKIYVNEEEEEETTKLVTSITLNKSSLSLKVGEKERLSAEILPENADNKKLTWSTSDNSVARVSTAGLVTAKKEGTTTITATATDGSGVFDTCEVTVTSNDLVSIEVTSLPTKTTYSYGETLDTSGLIITGTYEDSSTADVTSQCSISADTLETIGTVKVDVTLGSLSTYFNVSVSDVLSSFTVVKLDHTYNVGDDFSFDYVTLNCLGTQGSSIDVPTSEFSASPSTFTKVGKNIVTITHDQTGLYQEIEINVHFDVDYDGTDINQYYRAITDVSELSTGDVITLAATASDTKVHHINSTLSTFFGTTETIYSSEKGLLQIDNYIEFEIEKDGDVYYFRTGNKYLNCAGDDTNSLNKIELVDSKVANTSWSIIFDSTLNKYVIRSINNTSSRNTIYYYSQKISCYGYSSGKIAPTIYKKYTSAAQFSSFFLNELTCDDGITAPSQTIWNKYRDIFSTLDNTTLNILRSSIPDASSSSYVEQFVARYNYVINKYGYEDFLFESNSLTKVNNLTNESNKDILIAIIGVSSLIVIASLSYIILRKKHLK